MPADGRKTARGDIPYAPPPLMTQTHRLLNHCAATRRRIRDQNGQSDAGGSWNLDGTRGAGSEEAVGEI